MDEPIQLVPGQHIHFVGIGGTGMSAIARLLLLQGYQISGSDLRGNDETSALTALGAVIYQGHDAAQIGDAELLIVTSAVKDDHVEVAAARERGLPVYRRIDVMRAIMEGYTGIAIAGTHGKTTTTSMIVHILKEAQRDPTYIVGGVLANTGTNADAGHGDSFVIEADEYDNMFHGLRPDIAIITSVEFDHPDFFATPSEMIESFSQFVSLLSDNGLLIACVNDTTAPIFAHNRQVLQLPVLTYGIDRPANWQAINIAYGDDLTQFDVRVGDRIIGSVRLQMPGRHNILNALAALIVADQQGIGFAQAAAALTTFQGAGRRFDVRDDFEGIVIIDDYAHHPTAIETTIDAARQRYPNRELWVIWQPHTYSRTEALWDNYLRAFDAAHHVIVTDIYAAREPENRSIRASNFVNELQHESKFHAATLADAVELLTTRVQPPAAILIMSAGDAPQIGVDYLAHLRMDLT